jgi:uncharacterized protein involved in exopolysaccharide biosynthesis
MDDLESGSASLVQEVLGTAIAVLRRGWLVIAVSVVAFLAIGIAYLHMAVYRYEVSLNVTQVAPQSRAGLGQVSGLASMVGVSIPGAGPDMSQLYVESLQSRLVADRVSQNLDIMRRLFPDSWSDADKGWRDPQSFSKQLSGTLRSLVGAPPNDWHAPDGDDLHTIVMTQVTVAKTRTSPFITITMDTPDPELGKQFLMALHTVTDQILRQRAAERSLANISYLRSELDKVTIAEYREAILRVLADEEKQQMMAGVNVPFAAEPFGGAIQSSRPVSPKPLFVLLVCLILGFASGVALVLLRLRREDRLR